MAARIKGRTYDPQPATLDQLRARMDEFPLAVASSGIKTAMLWRPSPSIPEGSGGRMIAAMVRFVLCSLRS